MPRLEKIFFGIIKSRLFDKSNNLDLINEIDEKIQRKKGLINWNSKRTLNKYLFQINKIYLFYNKFSNINKIYLFFSIK